MKGLVLSVLCLLVFSPAIADAEDWRTIDGKTYKNVKVLKVEADTVTILDEDGGATIDISNLPSDLRKKLNYDPAKAQQASDDKFNAQWKATGDRQRVIDWNASGAIYTYDKTNDTNTVMLHMGAAGGCLLDIGWGSPGTQIKYPTQMRMSCVPNGNDATAPNSVSFNVDNQFRWSVSNPNFNGTSAGYDFDMLNFLMLGGYKHNSIAIEVNGMTSNLNADEMTRLLHFVGYVASLAPVQPLSGKDASSASADSTGASSSGNVPSAASTSESSNYTSPFSFKTLAGLAQTAGNTDGLASAARFNFPSGIAVDSHNNVYVCDSTTIRKIAPDGTVSTLAGLAGAYGNADGIGNDARFNQPTGVAVDADGNVYVVDSGNYNVRKITASGVVTTLAGTTGSAVPHCSKDGMGTAARFYDPVGIALDAKGNVYIADSGNCTIRKITPDGMVATLAGLAEVKGCKDGLGSEARFNLPSGVALDASGNVYVADSETLRKITASGAVSTLAGSPGHQGCTDGTGSGALFTDLSGIALDASGNAYVTDVTSTIRKITADGIVSTLAGSPKASGSADGTGNSALFSAPAGIAVDLSGNLYVTDTDNDTIRVGSPSRDANSNKIDLSDDSRGASPANPPKEQVSNGGFMGIPWGSSEHDVTTALASKAGPDVTSETTFDGRIRYYGMVFGNHKTAWINLAFVNHKFFSAIVSFDPKEDCFSELDKLLVSKHGQPSGVDRGTEVWHINYTSDGSTPHDSEDIYLHGRDSDDRKEWLLYTDVKLSEEDKEVEKVERNNRNKDF